MQTLSTYDPTLFEGAPWYYARYRSRYPDAVYERLVETFQLDGQGRLLDLGSGTGLIAIALHHHFKEVVGIDPDPEMLKEAQLQAQAGAAQNLTWLEQPAESISAELGSFRLVTIGRAFHWMQRDLVLERIYPLLQTGGGVAILQTHDDPWDSTDPWKQAAIAVVKKWLGEQRRTGQRGQGLWRPLEVSHEEILARSPFTQTERFEVPFQQTWTVESFTGYLYSTAFSLRAFYGDHAPEFETDLRDSLLAVEPSGHFTEILNASVLVARKS